MKQINECFRVIFSSHPHVADAIGLRWGHPEFYTYTESLITTSRHDRQGFSIEVIDAIMALQELHETIFK